MWVNLVPLFLYSSIFTTIFTTQYYFSTIFVISIFSNFSPVSIISVLFLYSSIFITIFQYYFSTILCSTGELGYDRPNYY